MQTKLNSEIEKIFQKHTTKSDIPFESNDFNKKGCIAELESLFMEMMIGFSEWIADSSYTYIENGYWYDEKHLADGQLTTSQLLDEYLKQTEVNQSQLK